MELILIEEWNYEISETQIIGVADNLQNCYNMINEYFGDFKMISNDAVRECDLIRRIEIIDSDNDSVLVSLKSIKLNQI